MSAAKPILDELSHYASENEAVAFAGFTEGQLKDFSAMLDLLYANISGPKGKG